MLINLASAVSALLLIVNPTSASKSSTPTKVTPSQNRHRIDSPNVYFPAKIYSEVEKADSISPVAKPAPMPYPTIDISPWMHPLASTEKEKDEIVKLILDQAKGAGSFNIIGHGIDTEFFRELDEATKSFFNLDAEEKSKFDTGNNKAGYVGMQQESASAIYPGVKENEKKDLRELYSCIYPPEHPENSNAPHLETLGEFMTKLQPVEIALSQILTAALNTANRINLPLDFLEKAKSGATGMLRSVRYTEMTKEYDDANRLMAHSDWGSLTLLYSSTPKGLEEIRNGEWVDVPLGPGQLHVTIGELLTMWSNELFTNNIHRVSNKAFKNRVSYAYFSGQGVKDDGTATHPVVGEGETPRFPPMSISQHSNNYMAALFGKEPK